MFSQIRQNLPAAAFLLCGAFATVSGSGEGFGNKLDGFDRIAIDGMTGRYNRLLAAWRIYYAPANREGAGGRR
ncbi:MAG: hypothetical protein LBK76_03610 [Verrucomicrobiales bacterium]|nr:hypothetical protein [Verrucomicrobiales bacterium]